MTVVPVKIAGELEIDLAHFVALEHIGTMALDQIKAALTIKNEEQLSAASRKQFGWWDMPEYVTLWRSAERRSGQNVLCLPRGFAANLQVGLAGLGVEVQWDDHRSRAPAAEGYFRPFVLRDYQLEAAGALLRHEQGFYKCPAGGGKTVTSLGMMAYANQRTLVITDKAGLTEQWRSRAAQFHDFPMERDEQGRLLSASLDGERTVGKIGENVWEERDLTVALRQTLYSRLWELDATGWWQTWGMVIFDEGHRLAAETLGEVCRRVTSHYMFGISATPAKSEIRGAVVHALVGPVVHETPRQVLYDRGVLMRPEVVVLPGDFKEIFWPDHDAEFDAETKTWNCEKPGCRESGAHSHRNNYNSVQSKLVKNEQRNERIVDQIMQGRGHHHLVFSRQKNILDLLKKGLVDAGWPKEKTWYLRGEENAAGLSQEIADQIMNSDESVVLSTVADEGLDIPPLDRIHLVFPMRQEGAVIQVVGRIERVAEGKEDAIIYDYREPLVDVLEGQFEERMRVYRMQSFNVSQVPLPKIRCWAVPERNEVWYQHLGCSKWFAPHDGADPQERDRECSECAAILPVEIVSA